MPALARIPLLIALICCAGAGQPLLDYVMPDAIAVFGVNIAQLKVSLTGSPVLNLKPEQYQQLAGFVSLTGFDPTRDLNDVVIAAGGSPRAKSTQKALVIASGKFDPRRMMDLLKTHGGRSSIFQGVEVLSLTDKQGQAQSVAFLGNSVLLGGDQQSVRAAIARQGRPSTLPPGVRERVADLSRRFDFWGTTVMPVSELMRTMPDDPNLKLFQGQALKPIDRASGGVKFAQDRMQLAVNLVAQSEEDARSLASVIQFFAGMMRMSAQGAPQQARSVLPPNAITIAGREVNIHLELTKQELEGFGQAFRQRAMRSSSRASAGSAASSQDVTVIQSGPAPDAGEIKVYSSPSDMGVVTLPAPK